MRNNITERIQGLACALLEDLLNGGGTHLCEPGNDSNTLWLHIHPVAIKCGDYNAGERMMETTVCLTMAREESRNIYVIGECEGTLRGAMESALATALMVAVDQGWMDSHGALPPLCRSAPKVDSDQTFEKYDEAVKRMRL